MDLYIIHGWTYTTKHWANTIKQLKQNGVNVIMLNVPGLTSPSNQVWTIDQYVDWANQNIPDGAVALGHSNGGRILLNLLSSNPDKLRQVILLDAAGIYEPSKKRDVARKLSKVFAPIAKIGILRKICHKVLGATDYDQAPENMKKTLANMLESDKSLDFAPITTPATILWGKRDTITPPRQAEKMHKMLPNSTLEFYDDWTHAPYICDPNGLAKAITKSLKEGTK